MKKFTLLHLFNSISGLLFCQTPATSKEALFKEWNYTDINVFGLVKLTDTREREYYKIVKTDAQTTKVYSYNAANVPGGMITLRFINGKISQMARTDRWGDTYEVTKFTPVAPGEFIVTRKNTGKNSFSPCKAARYIYRNHLISEVRYLDYTNKTAPFSDGVAIVKYIRYSDKDRFAQLKEIAYFDERGQPVISQSNDCHKVVYEYDLHCNRLSYAYYGLEDEPLTDRYGTFKTKAEFDEKDRQIKSVNLGLNDEPAENSFGVAGSSYEYRQGFQSKTTRFDDHFNTIRASDAGDGIAVITYEYDERGNEIKRSFFDENDQPINGHSGYQSVTYTFDPFDMLTSESDYDKYGNRAYNSDSIHRYMYVRDDKGRIIQKSYFDIYNNPRLDPVDRAYMVKYRYDEQGRVISESYWENSTTKMTRWNGFHEGIKKYNEDGLLIESAFYDTNGKLYVSSSGYSRIVTSYSTNGRLAERKYLDGNKCAPLTESFVSGFCTIRFAYDDKGRISNIRYFDGSPDPVTVTCYLNDEDLSFQRVEFIYTGNRIVEERLYAANSDTPSKIIDCLRQNYIQTSGVSEGKKNQ